MLVDGYLLALSLWPTPSGQHRLKQLVERLQIAAEDLHWHDATDDSEMLRRVLEEGAGARLAEMSEPLRELVTSAASGSPAWQLLDATCTAPRPSASSARARWRRSSRTRPATAQKLLRPEPPPPPDPDEDPRRPAASASTSPPRLRRACRSPRGCATVSGGCLWAG